MTYGKCPALSQFVDELVGLELTARKGLSVPPAVIGPSGRNHCFRERIIPARGNKVSFLSLRQIRVSTVTAMITDQILHGSVMVARWWSGGSRRGSGCGLLASSMEV